METSVPASDLDSEKRAIRFYKDLLAEVAALPGALHVGATGALPGHTMSDGSYWIDYLPKELNVSAPQAVFSMVAAGTFATLKIPLLEGRDFNDGDTYDAPLTAVINEKLAKEAFPGQDPIGHRMYCGFDLDSLKSMTIVGVIADIRQEGPAKPPNAEIIMPYQQHPSRAGETIDVLVRTAMDPMTLAEALRGQVRQLSPDVPVKFTTVEASLSEDAAAPRFRTLLLGVFAGLAVCLAMAGVYGVMSYVVGQRANELGLRMALGASPGDVLRLILRQALALAAAGIMVGLACAAAVTRLLQSMLFEVKATDLRTYVAVTAAMAAIALLASYIPARRAMRADPITALRYE